jgi:hypothetical protein
MAVGTGLSAYGQHQGGKAAARAGAAQQAAAYAEAAQLEEQAGQVRSVGQREAAQIRKEGERLKGMQRTYNAASGFSSSDVGSQVIAAETERELSMQELLKLAQSEDEARNKEFAAQMRRRGGQISAYEGRAAAKAGTIGAVSTLMTGAGDVWRQMPKLGRG